MGQQKAPKCHDCRHFYVSWDKRFPMGCKHLGFKGKQVPSVEVLKATGQHCVWFHPKPGCEAEYRTEVEVILPPGCSLSIEA